MHKYIKEPREKALIYFREAWRSHEFHEEIYADDIVFYAPMKE